MEEKDNSENSANEPLPQYGKRVTIFNSFEEEQEANYSYWRSLTSIQRLQLVPEMRIRVDPSCMDKNYKYTRVYFDKIS